MREIDVEIERSLDASDVWLLAWDGERLGRFRPPAVGEAIVVGAETPPATL